MTARDHLSPEQIAELTKRFGSVQAAAIEAIRNLPEEFAAHGVWLDTEGVPQFADPELERQFWAS